MQRQIETIRDFNRFYTRVLGLLGGRLYELPISLGQGRILWEIGRSPGCLARDLAQRLAMDPGQLSRTVTSLVKSNLVARTPSPVDARAKTLSLTAKGAKLLATIDEQASAQVADQLEPLSAEQRRRLLAAMWEIKQILSGNGG